jgi:hypothetical protein
MANPTPQESWNNTHLTDVIALELQYASPQNMVAITPGSALSTGVTNFCLYLTAGATVGLTTVGGQTVTVALPAGYNPLRVSAVASVSTGTAYALY